MHKRNTDDISLLIVSHSGIIADFLRNVFPEDVLTAKVAKWKGARPDLKTCSVTIVKRTGSEFGLVQVGNTAHLKNR